MAQSTPSEVHPLLAGIDIPKLVKAANDVSIQYEWLLKHQHLLTTDQLKQYKASYKSTINSIVTMQTIIQTVNNQLRSDRESWKEDPESNHTDDDWPSDVSPPHSPRKAPAIDKGWTVSEQTLEDDPESTHNPFLVSTQYRNIHSNVSGWRDWRDWATGKNARLQKLNDVWKSMCHHYTRKLQDIVESVEQSKAHTQDGRKVLNKQIDREHALFDFESVDTLNSHYPGLAQADYEWKQEKWNEVFKTDNMQRFCREQAYKIAQLWTMNYYGEKIVAYDVMFERMQPIFKAELMEGLSKIEDACETQDVYDDVSWLSALAVLNEFYYAFDQNSLHPLLDEMEFLTHSKSDKQQILYRLDELLTKENIDGKTVLSEIYDFLHDKLSK